MDLTFHEIDPNILREMIDRTLFSVSSDKARPWLNGALLEYDGWTCTLAASDGHRLAAMTRQLTSTLLEAGQGIIIPTADLKVLQKSKFDGLALADNCLYARKSTGVIQIPLINLKFPRYRLSIPDTNAQRTRVCWDDFRKALDGAPSKAHVRLEVVESPPIPCRYHRDHQMVVGIHDYSGNLISKSSFTLLEYGASQPGDVVVAFELKYLKQLLAKMRQGYGYFGFDGPMNPGLFRDGGWTLRAGYTGVIMPVRM